MWKISLVLMLYLLGICTWKWKTTYHISVGWGMGRWGWVEETLARWQASHRLYKSEHYENHLLPFALLCIFKCVFAPSCIIDKNNVFSLSMGEYTINSCLADSLLFRWLLIWLTQIHHLLFFSPQLFLLIFILQLYLDTHLAHSKN